MALAHEVFDTAMALMDEIDESGLTETADTEEYIREAPYVLNILIQETYPYSDTFVASQGRKRSVAAIIRSLADEIDLDDFICYSVLPYGLAAHLCLDDNPTNAAFFQQRYEEMLIKLRRGIPTESEDIYDVYSSGGYSDGIAGSGGMGDATRNRFGNGIGFEWTTRW